MSYIDEPQMIVRRSGQIVRFKEKGCNRQFYIQLSLLQSLCYSKKGDGYRYANVYIPHKTHKKLFNNKVTNLKTKE